MTPTYLHDLTSSIGRHIPNEVSMSETTCNSLTRTHFNSRRIADAQEHTMRSEFGSPVMDLEIVGNVTKLHCDRDNQY